MNERTKTITVFQLIELLKDVHPKTKVYISSDSEGNSFSTIDARYSISETMDKKGVILYPHFEGLDLDDIDSHASIRSDYYNKIYEECEAKGMSREECQTIAIAKAYDSDEAFNN